MAKIIKSALKNTTIKIIKPKNDEEINDEIEASLFYSIKIELSDGFVLVYPIAYETKKRIGNFLINLYQNSDQSHQGGYLVFETTPNRLVIVNLAQITGLTVLMDQINNCEIYTDHFECLDEGEKVTDENLLLPDAIVKLVRPFSEEEVRTYYSLSKEHINFIPDLWESGLDIPYFFNLIDDDGDDNYIPLHNIQCAEFDNDLFGLDEE